MTIITTLSNTSTAATFSTVGDKTSALSATIQKLQGLLNKAQLGGGAVVAMDQSEFDSLKASLDQWTRDGIEYQWESGAFQIDSPLFSETHPAIGVYNVNNPLGGHASLDYLAGSFGKIESSTAADGAVTYFLNVETLNAWTVTLGARSEVLATKDPASPADSDINPQMQADPDFTLSAGARKLAEVELAEVAYLQGVLENLISSFNGTPGGTLATLTYVDPNTREVITGKQLMDRLVSVGVLIGANKAKGFGSTLGSAVVNNLSNPTIYEIGLDTAQAWAAELKISEVLAKTVTGEVTDPSAVIDGQYRELIDPSNNTYSLDRARALYTAATRPRALFGSQPAAAIESEQAALSTGVAAILYGIEAGTATDHRTVNLGSYTDQDGVKHRYGTTEITSTLNVPSDLLQFRYILSVELGTTGPQEGLAQMDYVVAGGEGATEQLTEKGLQGAFNLWQKKADLAKIKVSEELLDRTLNNGLGWSSSVGGSRGTYEQLLNAVNETTGAFTRGALNNAYNTYAAAAFDKEREIDAHSVDRVGFAKFRLQIGTLHDFMVSYAGQSHAAATGQVMSSLQQALDDLTVDALTGQRAGLLGKPGDANNDFATMNYYQAKAAASIRIRGGLQYMRLIGSGFAAASVINAIAGAAEDGISDRERGTRIFSAIAWTASLLQVPAGVLANAAEKYFKGQAINPAWTKWSSLNERWLILGEGKDPGPAPPYQTVAQIDWEEWYDKAMQDVDGYEQYRATHPEPPRTYGEYLAAETRALHSNLPHGEMHTNWEVVKKTASGFRLFESEASTVNRLPSIVEHRLRDAVEVGRPNWIWDVEVGSEFRRSTNGYVFAKNGMFWAADLTSLALNLLRASNAMSGPKPDPVNAAFFSLAVGSDVLITAGDVLGTFAIPGSEAARLAGNLMTAGYAAQVAVSVAQTLYNGTIEYQRHPYSAEGVSLPAAPNRPSLPSAPKSASATAVPTWISRLASMARVS